MASTTRGGHGGKRRNSGRKKMYGDSNEAKKAWRRSHKRIYLRNNIFQSWQQAKVVAGYKACSDSAFAGHLLSMESRRRSSEDVSSVPPGSVLSSSNSQRQKHVLEENEGTQTPMPAKPLGQSSSIAEAPIVDCDENCDENIDVIS